jgi:alanine racemase
VIRVLEVPVDAAIGYDEEPTTKPMRVAAIAAGYGDGYPRRLSGGRGQVLIRGRRAPVAGLVCMDQLMADVTDIPQCRRGDTATLLGDGISLQEMADWAGTNRNECMTILSQRPVRRYWQGGRIVLEEDELMNLTEVKN